jgi:hypothetical protein
MSKQTFDYDQVLTGVAPADDSQCRFDYRVLERVLKSIIQEKLCDEDASMIDEGSPSCPTFVVSTSGLNVDGPAKLFRSYRCKGFSADKCCIWQAGRGTSASPTLFKPIFVDKPPPGAQFIDGGIGHNNPSELALDEARRLFPGVKRFCLVSVGTGRQRTVKFIEATLSASSTVEENITYDSHSEARRAKEAEKLTRVPAGISILAKIGEACVALSTSSEAVHRRIYNTAHSQNPELVFPYYRFNVEREMDAIELQEWEKMIEIGDHTRRHMTEVEVEVRKDMCARDLHERRAVERTSSSELSF